jgi:iron(III) transport system ATP-binding protein
VEAVAIARLLLSDPAVLLLDQPLRALRPQNRKALIGLLAQRKGKATTVVVSDAAELLEIADQIVVMREGAVAFAGTPAELLEAQQKAVAAQMAAAQPASIGPTG